MLWMRKNWKMVLAIFLALLTAGAVTAAFIMASPVTMFVLALPVIGSAIAAVSPVAAAAIVAGLTAAATLATSLVFNIIYALTRTGDRNIPGPWKLGSAVALSVITAAALATAFFFAPPVAAFFFALPLVGGAIATMSPILAVAAVAALSGTATALTAIAFNIAYAITKGLDNAIKPRIFRQEFDYVALDEFPEEEGEMIFPPHGKIAPNARPNPPAANGHHRNPGFFPKPTNTLLDADALPEDEDKVFAL